MTNLKVQQHIITTVAKDGSADSYANENLPKINDNAKASAFIVTEDKMQINWFHTIMLTTIPSLAIYGMFTTKLTIPTLVLSVIMYFWTGLGITAGKAT
jgi:hypothetical protein